MIKTQSPRCLNQKPKKVKAKRVPKSGKAAVESDEQCLYSAVTKKIFWLQSLHQPYEEVLARSVFFFFSIIVNYATFVSNDKVNERIFQSELALPE